LDAQAVSTGTATFHPTCDSISRGCSLGITYSQNPNFMKMRAALAIRMISRFHSQQRSIIVSESLKDIVDEEKQHN
jgi:hypothetical protein